MERRELQRGRRERRGAQIPRPRQMVEPRLQAWRGRAAPNLRHDRLVDLAAGLSRRPGSAQGRHHHAAWTSSARRQLAWGWRRGLPLKWTGATMNAQQSQVAIEQLEIAHEGLTMVTGGSTGLAVVGAAPRSGRCCREPADMPVADVIIEEVVSHRPRGGQRRAARPAAGPAPCAGGARGNRRTARARAPAPARCAHRRTAGA